MPIGMALRAMMGAAGRAVGIWPPYLYKEGEEYPDGWSVGFTNHEGGSRQTILTKEPTYLYLKGISNDTWYPEGSFATDEKVDLTDYNTLKVDWEALDTNSWRVLGCHSTNRDRSPEIGWWSPRTGIGFTADRRTTSLDISGISGLYYVCVGFTAEAWCTSEVKVYAIWLE